MPDESRKRCGGFTYLAVLILIIIMGIMLGVIGQSWQIDAPIFMKVRYERVHLFDSKTEESLLA